MFNLYLSEIFRLKLPILIFLTIGFLIGYFIEKSVGIVFIFFIVWYYTNSYTKQKEFFISYPLVFFQKYITFLFIIISIIFLYIISLWVGGFLNSDNIITDFLETISSANNINRSYYIVNAILASCIILFAIINLAFFGYFSIVFVVLTVFYIKFMVHAVVYFSDYFTFRDGISIIPYFLAILSTLIIASYIKLSSLESNK